MRTAKPSLWWVVPVVVAAVVFVDKFVALFASGRAPKAILWPYNLFVLLGGIIWLIVICLRQAPPPQLFRWGFALGAAFGLVQVAHLMAWGYTILRYNEMAPTGLRLVSLWTVPPLGTAVILGLVVGGIVAKVVRLAGGERHTAGH